MMAEYHKDKQSCLDAIQKQVEYLTKQVSLLWERVREMRHEIDESAKKIINMSSDTDKVHIK